MIPPDVISRLQVSAETTLRPVAPSLEISDKLSDLVPGQKVMAEIQAFLPNGTYRALINQRNITLALPFSAKSGDVLEMLVTESDGKVALAVVEHPEEGQQKSTESASASLSNTGQLIGRLLSGTQRQPGGRAAPVALNQNQPLTNSPPVGKQDILPVLKQAIIQSGMFYESHQAEWLEGRFTKAALLQEPQGKLSSPAAFVDAQRQADAAARLPFPETAGEASRSPNAPGLPNALGLPNAPEQPNMPGTAAGLPETPGALGTPVAADQPGTQNMQGMSDASETSSLPPGAKPEEAVIRGEAHLQEQEQQTISGDKALLAHPRQSVDRPPDQMVAPSVQFLVQQQLEALANQKFAWQGLIWPGQKMYWEIDDEEDAHRSFEEDESVGRWSTRLRLTLPNLGEIDARIRLQGNQISLSMHASPETCDQMRAAGDGLQTQFDEAGLVLAMLGVDSEMERDEHVPE